jgi:cyclopropane fatty-acyl-phospholipid synthase-like methyltransferase
MSEANEWFSDWFDTNYYHILYKNRDENEARILIKNLCEFLAIKPNSSLLDLACGKGRHSITLNGLGHKVLGVDLSQNSISIAKQHERRGLHFEVHDMRKIIPGLSFDVIFNLFTSFGYFDSSVENKKVIFSVANMLYDKGIFVIDFLTAQKVIANLVASEEKTIEDIQFLIERKIEGDHVFKKITVIDKNITKKYIERVQLLTLSDFVKLLSPEFKIIHTFGSFDLQSFDPSASDRLIIIAEKNV